MSQNNTSHIYERRAFIAAMGFDEELDKLSIDERSESVNKQLIKADFVTLADFKARKNVNKNERNIVELIDEMLKNCEAFWSLTRQGETLYHNMNFVSLFSFVGGLRTFNFIKIDGLEVGFWLFQAGDRNMSVWIPSFGLMICFSDYALKFIKRTTVIFSVNLAPLVNSIKISKKTKTYLYCSYNRPFHYFCDLLTTYYNLKNHVNDLPDVVLLKKTTFFDAFSENDPEVFNRVFDDEYSLNCWLLQNEALVFRPVNIFDKKLGVDYYDWIRGIASNVSLSYLSDISEDDFVLWIGICAEKRSWYEKREGVESLIRHYSGKKKNLVVILDGLTRSEFEERHDFCENVGKKDFAFAEKIANCFPEVHFINSVGFSSKEKIVLAQRVDFFVTSFLTDSIYVARFAERPGVAYGARASHPRQHRHPNTFLLPNSYVRDRGVQDRGSSVKKSAIDYIDYSIDPKKLVDFCDKVDSALEVAKSLGKLLAGTGFQLELCSVGNFVEIKSESNIDSYICLGENSEAQFENFSVCTAAAHTVEKRTEYLFRFEAFSNYDSVLYIIGYDDGVKVFTYRMIANDSKYITFPEGIDKFRLFIRLSAGDVLRFYDVFWTSSNVSACSQFSIDYRV